MSATKTRRIVFTKKAIEGLRSPASGRVYIYDAKTTGLAICCTAAGGRVFYHYRKVDGKPERYMLGKWPKVTVEQARDEADRKNGLIADGVNPSDKRRVNRNAPTLGEVFDEYIGMPTRGKSKRPRSAKTTLGYRNAYDNHLAKDFGNRRLSTIRRSELEQLHNSIGEGHGHTIANRVLALVKSLFNYAIEQEYFPINPATRLKAFEEHSRERYLAADEMPAFWKAVEADPCGDFFKVALLTGARSGNVRTMRWDDVDLATAVWKIPTSKTGKPLTLPLTQLVVDILIERKTTATSAYVFPGRNPKRPLGNTSRSWKRIKEAAGITDIRIHDLRRSLGSWQAVRGSSLTIIGKSLGHDSLQATKIYARVDLEAVRSSVDAAVNAMFTASKVKPAKEGASNG